MFGQVPCFTSRLSQLTARIYGCTPGLASPLPRRRLRSGSWPARGAARRLLPLPWDNGRDPGGFFLNYPLPCQFTCVGTNWSSSLAEKQAWAKRYHEGGDFHPKVNRGKLVPRLLFGGWCSNRRRRRRPPPFSKGVMAQPGWHWVPSNSHPDPLGKSEQELGKYGEDADISYAVPLTYPSIQKSRFVDDKYLLTRHVSNSVGFFFPFNAELLFNEKGTFLKVERRMSSY